MKTSFLKTMKVRNFKCHKRNTIQVTTNKKVATIFDKKFLLTSMKPKAASKNTITDIDNQHRRETIIDRYQELCDPKYK